MIKRLSDRKAYATTLALLVSGLVLVRDSIRRPAAIVVASSKALRGVLRVGCVGAFFLPFAASPLPATVPQTPVSSTTVRACASDDPENVRHLFTEARTAPLSHPAEWPIAELTSIAVGPTGTIAVTDSKDYNVKLFDEHGRFIRVLGRRGDGPGEFRMPAAATFLNDTLILVVDRYQRRLSAFSSGGAFVGSGLLRGIRAVGRVEGVRGDLFVGGLGPIDRPGWRDSLWLVHRADTTGTVSQSFGRMPASYSRYPALLSGPVYIATSGSQDSTLFVTGRFLADIWKFDVGGKLVDSVAIPRTRGFVDPREVVADLRGGAISGFSSRVSPIIGLVASGNVVLVGYVSLATGDNTLRWDVFDRGLTPVGTGMPGPLFVAARGDTLIAVEGVATEEELDVRYRLAWYIPC